LIPIDGATDTITLDSANTNWESFSLRIAAEIGVKKDCLNLTYKLSTAKQKDLPKVLSKAIHLAGLWEDIRKEKKVLSTKRGVTKDLHVMIIDRSAGKKEKGKGASKVVIFPFIITFTDR
jgi:hypothetical protein